LPLLPLRCRHWLPRPSCGHELATDRPEAPVNATRERSAAAGGGARS
jgi:hypothetical protein